MENNNLEKEFEEIFKNMPEAIAVYGPVSKGSNFIIRYFNRSAEKIEKVKASKIINKRITEVFPSVKNFGILQVLRRVWKTGRAERFPLSFYKDKRISGWRDNHVIRMSSGNLLVVYTDETKNKQHEENLKDSERRYKMIVDNVNDAFYLHDFKGNILDVNDNACKMTGYTRNELIGANASIVDTQEQAKFIPGRIRRLIKIGRLLFDSQHRKKSGAYFWVNVSAKIVSREGNGLIESFVRDITKQKNIENKLRESEERYRSLISNLPKTEYVMVHRNGKLLWVNNNALSFLGYSRKKMIGTSVFDYLEIEYQKIVLRNIMKREAGKKVSEYEIKIRDKKGQMRDVLIKGSATNYEGQLATLLVISDITERKLSENKIIESESRYRSLFDLSNDAIFLMKGNIFIECNKKTLEMFGCRKDQIIGKPPYSFSPKKQPDGRSSLVSANEKIKNALSGKPQFFEWRHNRFNGLEFDAEVSLNNIKISEEEYVLASVRDISERKRAEKLLLEDEEKLKESNSDLIKFKLAVDNASDDIIITDQKGVVLYANPALEINSGYSLSEIIGKTPAIWGRQMSGEFYKNFWNTILREKDPFIGEMKNKRKNGELYIAEIRVSPILNNENEVKFFVGISRDITKIKELDRAKSEFVSVASHQLKTPISGIKWTLESILQNRENNLNQKQIEWLKNVYDNNERMIKLVNDLLNISRIDSGKYAVLNLNKVEIASLVERAIKNLSSFAADRKVVIEYKNNLPAGYSLTIDEDKIYQAISNLISNSIKYSKPEGGRSEVITKIKNKELFFSVKDNGVGIPIQNQRHIFEKFFRADNASTSHASGSGLGLYIAKYFVENHKGKIWFESKEGVGTTFSFTVGSDLV
jgi:PAS domain S-box-containing protein